MVRNRVFASSGVILHIIKQECKDEINPRWVNIRKVETLVHTASKLLMPERGSIVSSKLYARVKGLYLYI
jgi:hypothetical protein